MILKNHEPMTITTVTTIHHLCQAFQLRALLGPWWSLMVPASHHGTPQREPAGETQQSCHEPGSWSAEPPCCTTKVFRNWSPIHQPETKWFEDARRWVEGSKRWTLWTGDMDGWPKTMIHWCMLGQISSSGKRTSSPNRWNTNPGFWSCYHYRPSITRSFHMCWGTSINIQPLLKQQRCRMYAGMDLDSVVLRVLSF